MSNFAITTKLNIYIPMEKKIINNWGDINEILEEAGEKKDNKHAKDFAINFLNNILEQVLGKKNYSFLPLIYGINEDTDDEFKILVCVTFETTYSKLCISNDKLLEMESNNFYDKLINLLEQNNCEYQIYESFLI